MKDLDVSVYVNDKLIKSYTSVATNIKLLLSVKKGDYVIFKLSGCSSQETWNATLYVRNLYLSANVETPYTYRTITEGTEYTDDDIEGGQYQ